MKIDHGVEAESLVDGTYAVQVYFGWKLLERKSGEWWHISGVGRWTASEPLQWVGPLPPLHSKTVYDL